MDDLKTIDLVAYGGEVKALGDGRVAGYLIRFTTPVDPDLEGDFFTPDTVYGKKSGDTIPIFYHHGMDSAVKSRQIGRGELKWDDVGLWIEAQLELRDEYEKAIYEMAANGKLGWSSGAAGYLAEREPVGKTNHIKTWIIAEGSLTPTPAEPRNGVIPIKSLEAPEICPEAAQSAGGNDGDPYPVSRKTMEINTMDETLKSEIGAIVAEAVKAAMPAPEAPVGAVIEGAPAVKKVTDLGFKDDEVKSFLHWIKTGDDKPYKAAMQGQTDSEGGYAVPDDFYNKIVAKRNEVSIIRQMGVVNVNTSLDRLLVPAEDTAATKFVVTAEEGAYDENEPTLGQVAITVHKLTKLIKISEELEADAKADFGGYLSSVWGRAMAAAENYYLVASGTGTGMPQSLLQGATSSGITTTSATAITAAELLQLIYKVPEQYADNLAIVMARATLGSIRALTGNPFSFIPNPSGEGTGMNPGSLHGIPVYITSAMPAMTAGLKSCMIVNPDFYMVAEREGLTVTRNPWLYQANGQIGLFAKFRLGGAVTQAEAHYYMTQHA